MKKKMAGLAILVVSLLLVMSTLTLNIQPAKANPGCITIKVQYQDGCPRSGAFVKETYTGWFGVTNESGYASISGFQPKTVYEFKAYWPDLGHQFGPTETIITDGNGDGNGNVTITANYEIALPTIEILSPENKTYTSSSVPLTFTVTDYSPISWMGYSLDNQPNATITGNTTLSLSLIHI